MTDYQKSKRRGDSTPAEKQTIADALDRETSEEYRKRIRILEEKVADLERIARSLGYHVCES